MLVAESDDAKERTRATTPPSDGDGLQMRAPLPEARPQAPAAFTENESWAAAKPCSCIAEPRKRHPRNI